MSSETDLTLCCFSFSSRLETLWHSRLHLTTSITSADGWAEAAHPLWTRTRKSRSRLEAMLKRVSRSRTRAWVHTRLNRLLPPRGHTDLISTPVSLPGSQLFLWMEEPTWRVRMGLLQQADGRWPVPPSPPCRVREDPEQTLSSQTLSSVPGTHQTCSWWRGLGKSYILYLKRKTLGVSMSFSGFLKDHFSPSWYVILILYSEILGTKQHSVASFLIRQIWKSRLTKKNQHKLPLPE